ncbi:dihydroorotate dehydrogenase electron transfer subunit [Cohnella hongkongensis]|uniref:Dihydroorotate dehydrogenase electron transfer subunit n=1 Tax=Cohnella hongkongensis TaxID=178337 RepID=A0ABV9FD55_9BACL
MADVLSNIRVSSDCRILTVGGQYEGRMGQFYMVRGWELYPLLSRPLSIYDLNEAGISFLYRVVGQGTQRLADLRRGDRVELNGPIGNGFPDVDGRVALVGGGLGAAPLYFAARQLPGSTAYLGFSGEAIADVPFRSRCAEVIVKIGGSIVDEIEPSRFDAVFACGPRKMLQAMAHKAQRSGAALYVSVESRMACGVGACLVCSCPTTEGSRRVCADGPVFSGEEVRWDEWDRV